MWSGNPMFNLKMSKKMKKFFSLMLVALVMLGVTACEQDVTIDTPKSEGLSFYAEIAMTRADLEQGDDGKWATVWEGNETLTVYNEEHTEFYKFTNSIEEPNMFSCTEEGVENIVGQNIIIELTHGEDCYISDMGKKGLLISEFITEFNPTEPISLHARNSFLRYTYNGEGIVTLSLEYEGMPFITNDIPGGASTYTSSNTGEQWVSFDAPNVEDGSVVSAVLSYSINDVKVKATTLNLAQGKIYNLGTLTEPEMTTIYLVPGVWESDSPNFSVYYWKGALTDEVIMTKDETKSGVYKANILADAEGLIFKRLSPADGSQWNQTGDLTLPTDGADHYYVTGWGATEGEWREYVVKEWAVAGTFNGWSDFAMTRVNSTISYATGIELTAYNDLFKVKEAGTWDTSYGAGFGYMIPGHYMKATFNGGDIAVTVSGTYDIYFDEANAIIYVVAAGVDYTTAAEQTVNGPAPITGNRYYFKPNSNWTQGSAKFSGYFWNASGNKWAELTDGDGDGIYECNLGEWTPTSVIFLRKDPSGFVYNNWTYWDRIGNITVPDGMNFYTMAGGVWTEQIESGSGYTGGTWSTK